MRATTEREAADAHEFEWALRQFGPPGESFDETVCVMALPAEDDPVQDIGPEEKHATVLYFGDRSKSADPERIEGSKNLFLDVLRVAAKEVEPFDAAVKGIEQLGDEGAQVWLLDSPDLRRLFEEIPGIDSEIHSMYEDADATRYPEYKPHVTIGYPTEPDGEDDQGAMVEMLDEAEPVKSIHFDRLSLWWGNEHIDVPLGSAEEFDALLAHFGFDPSQPRAADGKWNPGGEARNKKKKKDRPKPRKKAAPEPPKMSKSEREAHLVKGILKALDSVLDDLSSAQAHALIERIKDNAHAFIEGQASAPHHGGGGHHKGAPAAKGRGGPAKKGKPAAKGKGTPSSNTGPSGMAGIIAGVKGLLKMFGHNMKPKDRQALQHAVNQLD